jgi:hypothetical protein
MDAIPWHEGEGFNRYESPWRAQSALVLVILDVMLLG